MINMQIQDLNPGDIIFYTDSKNNADHVGIFKEIKDRVPYLLHAVQGRYNRLLVTKLPVDINFSVYRAHDSELAEAALALLHHWSRYGVPYDERRNKLMQAMEDKREHMDIQNYLAYNQQRYHKNYYRILKFSARVHTSPVLFRKNNLLDPQNAEPEYLSRGMRCDQAVILAFQCAELKQLNLIDANKIPSDAWVSDKYANNNLIEQYQGSEAYRAYQKKIQSPSEYPSFWQSTKKRVTPEQKCFYPSIAIWNGEKSIEDFFSDFESCVVLDSKSSSPNLLKYYMDNHANHWQSVGHFQIHSAPVVTEEAKKNWRERLELQKLFANQLQTQQLNRLIAFLEPPVNNDLQKMAQEFSNLSTAHARRLELLEIVKTQTCQNTPLQKNKIK
jgi:hypothetical protein